MEIGSHTVTHPRLSGLDPEMLGREVDDSREMLGEIVSTPVQGFSYPCGDLDGSAVWAVRSAGYIYAVATKKQLEYGIYNWPRTYVGERDSPLTFRVKLEVGPILTRWRRSSLG
jgi:peptidoglycan/xylan/chitin deacetylase (PgdA/CDA1 family)